MCGPTVFCTRAHVVSTFITRPRDVEVVPARFHVRAHAGGRYRLRYRVLEPYAWYRSDRTCSHVRCTRYADRYHAHDILHTVSDRYCVIATSRDVVSYHIPRAQGRAHATDTIPSRRIKNAHVTTPATTCASAVRSTAPLPADRRLTARGIDGAGTIPRAPRLHCSWYHWR